MKEKSSEKFKEYYKRQHVTGTYDAQREGTEYRKKKRKLELEIFLDLIDKREDEKVLELGCSSGFLTKHLGKVTAVDTSEGMLKIAYSKNNMAKCVYADMFEMPFKQNSFDKVVTMRVWNHLDEEEFRKALRETKRVLKKNGKFIFDMEDKSSARRAVSFFYKRITKVTGYKIFQYSFREIEKILREEGFKIDRTKFLKHRVGRQIVLRTTSV